MLTEICQYLRNWFERDKLLGDFKVSDGVLTYADGTPIPLLPDQYYRVIGSVFNDGVHKLGDGEDVLKDETFSGAVWSMAIPPDVLLKNAEIEKWLSDNEKAITSPYQSESFGGYSYSLKSGGVSSDGSTSGMSWQSQFAAALAPWRKI